MSEIDHFHRIGPEDHEAFVRWIRGENAAILVANNSSKVGESSTEYSFSIDARRISDDDQLCLAYPLGDSWRIGAICTFHVGNFAVLAVRIEDGPDEFAIRMIQSIIESARARHVELVQLILNEQYVDCPVTTERLANCLTLAGMKPLTELLRMDLDMRTVTIDESEISGKGVKLRQDIAFHCAELVETKRLVRLTERTYRGSLDCSELDGVRSTEQTLRGYRDASHSQQTHWWIASLADADVGCIYLSEIGFDVWELTYMGVVPEFRKHGIGQMLLMHGINQCKKFCAAHLTLAVDYRNFPAITMYHKIGFEALQTIKAWYWHPRMQ